MINFIFEEKGGSFEASEQHPNCEVWRRQHHVVELFCCRRDWCTSQNRSRKQYTLRQHLKTSATTLNLGCKLVFRMDNDPKHTSKLVTKCFKDNKVRVSEWPSQSPDLSPTENLWAALKRWVTARRPTNPTQLHQFCLSVSPDSRKLLRKFVEGNLKRLAEVKQFDSNSTKY